jgi:hypothetical protein
VETFTELKELTENSYYQIQRQDNLRHLTDDMIDPPILEIVKNLNKLPYCFTLQSCYGHFVYEGRDDPNNLEPLPIDGRIGEIEYRIAYIAFCIENSHSGKKLFLALKEFPLISPQNIQFCCAEWFWERQVNSYALQVEPDRFKHQDTAIIDLEEALHIEKLRNDFFIQLRSFASSAAAKI